MFRVLIVDDEEAARETFKYLINWENTHYQLGGFASNGQEALKKYKEIKPDLIITDIQMPVMDGLEFIRKVRIINPNQLFVILTCYENFNYAREAIKLGVSDYLLKDLLTSDDMYELLEKMEEKLNYDAKKYSIAAETSNEQEYIDALYKPLLMKKIVSEKLSLDEIKQYCEQYHLNLNDKYKTIFAISVDKYKEFLAGGGAEKEEKFNREILWEIEGLIHEKYSGECFYDRDGIFTAVVGMGDMISQFLWISTCYQIASAIREKIHKVWSLSVTIGISENFSALTKLKDNYDSAVKLIRNKVFLGTGKTMFYGMLEFKVTHQKVDYEKIESDLKDVKKALFAQNKKMLVEKIDAIYSDNIKSFELYEYLKNINLQLLGVLLEYLSKNEIEYKNIFHTGTNPLNNIYNLETIEEMKTWFLSMYTKGIDTYYERTVFNKHIKSAIDYIEKNYRKKITLSAISEEIGVNQVYFCRIFKKETGQNFTDYVNKVRIKHAQELIRNSDYKLYEIAEIVGFTTSQHFNSSFKRATGINPLKYKNSVLQDL